MNKFFVGVVAFCCITVATLRSTYEEERQIFDQRSRRRLERFLTQRFKNVLEQTPIDPEEIRIHVNTFGGRLRLLTDYELFLIYCN